jgi:S-adenosylmethionine decarboxylase
MPGMEAASAYTDLRRQEAASPKRLYAVDARCGPQSPVTDIGRLTQQAMSAVAAGGGHVLDASHVVFPNGAITLVLILAESHLSIHTWPEEDLIAIDLFSCGGIDGQAVIGGLTAALGLTDVSISQLARGAPSWHAG